MSAAFAPIKNIVILGGGTAGWMSAHLMAACWQTLGINITLIESRALGIIGVGEGSTPQLKSFFDFLGFAENQWMPKCNATYKNGITFAGWSSKPGFDSYFHAFESEVDFKTQPAFFYNCEMRRKGVNIYAHPDTFYLNSILTKKNLAPIEHDNFPFKVSYGYHFDAALLGEFLHEQGLKRGSRHIDAKVESACVDEQGNIESLILDSREIIKADFFVDCTGFSSQLLQRTLKVPFINFEENLFNDSAVTIATPKQENFKPQTVSTAKTNGWVWNIPLANRSGNGYVYSSSYCSADDAETELRQHLNMLDSDVQARHIKMKVGQVEQHWYRNCLAVGLSQGFIEPLEATALHLVQETIQGFIDAYELGNFTDINQQKFNHRINEKFEGIRDYIVAHYVLNSRQDSNYWYANRQHNKLSDDLKNVLASWHQAEDVNKVLRKRDMEKHYTSMSWHSILSGYGMYHDEKKLLKGSVKAHKYELKEISTFLERCSLNFSNNQSVLQQMYKRR